MRPVLTGGFTSVGARDKVGEGQNRIGSTVPEDRSIEEDALCGRNEADGANEEASEESMRRGDDAADRPASQQGDEDVVAEHADTPGGEAPRSRAKKPRLERKTAVQVASLNMNGYGNLVRDHPDNKWGCLYRVMSEHRIGILLIQETHLTSERVAGIHRMFAKRLRILHSEHPQSPTQREGVAVVLNARYVKTADVRATEIVPGRAIQVLVPCPGGDAKNILCIYAPTSDGVAERKRFFDEVSRYYEEHPAFPKPHLMAGDFNNVEDALDRLPVSGDPDPSIIALDKLKMGLGMMLADGWRVTYPNVKEYTFHRGTGTAAVFFRLDRIYVTPEIFDCAREWRICEAGVKTDHSLIMVELTPENAPIVGQGRPVFPVHLIKDRKLANDIKRRGLVAMEELAKIQNVGGRTDNRNPQRILQSFKLDAMRLGREREKEVVPKLLAEIREREKALRSVKANSSISEADKLAEAASLTKQIRHLKQRRYKQQQQNSRATHRLYGERPTKYWSKLHRECSPRDVINAFEKEDQCGVSGEKVYETDSNRMAEMARVHHMNVQKDDQSMKPVEEREADIEVALRSLDVEVTDAQAIGLGGEITCEEIRLSLRFSKNGSSPGLDGIPFELWKALHSRYIEDLRFEGRMKFDIVKLMTAAYEDVRTHGVDPKTSFARGWIAPIYKEKGERTKVVNYRPITLLNTDYKILSKTLAVRLADVAPCIIHRAQAGFVPGRRIQNHTQLARMMMSWTDMNGMDGAIVALDQEKAYDKIAHDYLWRVLRQFKIPEVFIRLIKSLYENAETSVMVNGILSKAYRVYRGVRQGDPLSCLLFDLAIEPLSAMIRKSDIEGFTIPRCNETLKAVLFADDTTVYLSRRDDFNVLQRVLDTWCSVAKARFNIGKTEIIPMGSEEFRHEMAETYRVTGRWKNYPRNVHVAQEGEAVRILGAFFGNGIDQVAVWTLVLNRIVAMRKPLMQVIERWRNGHASVQGKRHVIQMIVGGMTQFLTTVQRMPEAIRERLTKIIRSYLWDGRGYTPVALDTVYLPVAAGGLGMVDLEARNEAIDIMWLRSYLTFGEDRPTWAYLADDLFANHVPKDCRPRAVELRISPFLQRWKPRVRGLPAELTSMMKVAKKYGLRLEGIALSNEILTAMPMWDHVYADRTRLGRLTVPSKLLTCLQRAHNARTVGDFVEIARTLSKPLHKAKATCKCSGCAKMRADHGCRNPHLCGARANDMIGTLPAKWNPSAGQPEDYEGPVMVRAQKEQQEDGNVLFDRRVTTHGDIGHAFRIFTDKEPVVNGPVDLRIDEDGTSVVLATDGSCLHNGERRAQAGAGVYAEHDHGLNRSIRLPDDLEQSNQTGEIAATLVATRLVDERTRVVQETDSQTTMDSLTKWRQKHEDTGYLFQKNAYLTRVTIAALRGRKAHTLFKWVKGHSGHSRNEAADELAGLGAGRGVGDDLDRTINPMLKVTGAKLQAMTQRLAYRAIRNRKDANVKSRPRTDANMNRILTGIEAVYGAQLREENIWLSLRTRHVLRPVSQYMWMAIHDGYMLGTHWLRPNMSAEMQTRAVCSVCGECETMSHIVLECRAVGQELIWALLKETWRLTKATWHEPCWGTVFGAACAVIMNETGTRMKALEELWCILCTEALHLIWKLRCERVIQKEGVQFSDNEITNRYYAAMDSRLNLDRRTAARARGKRALKPKDVERIWLPVLRDGHKLPPKWVVDSRVLVGIERG